MILSGQVLIVVGRQDVQLPLHLAMRLQTTASDAVAHCGGEPQADLIALMVRNEHPDWLLSTQVVGERHRKQRKRRNGLHNVLHDRWTPGSPLHTHRAVRRGRRTS